MPIPENITIHFSEDKDIVIWFHDGIHGTKGYVSKDGEWDAIIEGVINDAVCFSIGKKRLKRRFFPTINGIAMNT